MDLEHELQNALRRPPAPAGFAGRVLRRIEGRETRSTTRAWRAVAASLLLAAILGGWINYRIEVRRHKEGERARAQVMLALRIAGEKVRYAQREVRGLAATR